MVLAKNKMAKSADMLHLSMEREGRFDERFEYVLEDMGQHIDSLEIYDCIDVW